MLLRLTLVPLIFVAACGTSSSKKEDPPVVVYGNLTIADSKTPADNGVYALTQADTCSRDVASGLVKIALSQGAGKPSLTINIKNYSATAKTYTCTQTADNQTSPTDVGSLFDTCAVDAKGLSAAGAVTLDGFSMYREAVAVKPFKYAGACTVDVTSVPPTAKGTISCAGLVQTVFEGTPRNPLNEEITATATGDFNCNFR